jgi:hypothetical protein
MSTPYSISLLNDLHNHFPDLLYRPNRFRNVSDVLNYIIGVAQYNPYDDERVAYEQRNTLPSAPAAPSVPSAVPVIIPSSRSSINNLLNANYVSPLQSDIFAGASQLGRSRRSIFPSQPVDPIMSFLGELIGGSSVGIGTSESVGIRVPSSVGIGSTGPFGRVDMQAFLNDRVHVSPSPEQIEAGTILTTALQTQEDNCTICQDPIEQNQPMRIIRHCTHRFHQDCIDTWFQQHVSCPTCRHDIRE